MLKETLLTAAMAAAISTIGTYSTMRFGDWAKPDNGPVLAELLNVERQTFDLQSKILASITQVQSAQLQMYTNQLLNDNRQLILGRLLVRSITNTDPLPLLQAAKSSDMPLPDTADIVAKKKFNSDIETAIAAGRQHVK